MGIKALPAIVLADNNRRLYAMTSYKPDANTPENYIEHFKELQKFRIKFEDAISEIEKPTKAEEESKALAAEILNAARSIGMNLKADIVTSEKPSSEELAKALATALTEDITINNDIIKNYYSDIVEKVIANDPKDVNGLKKKELSLKKIEFFEFKTDKKINR